MEDKVPILDCEWIYTCIRATKTAIKGRASGGILIGIKKDKKNLITIGKTVSGWYIKCNQMNSYILPAYINCNNWKHDKELLENRLQELGNWNVMILGDLNARIGEKQIGDCNPERMFRSSKDKVTNANGTALLKMLDMYGLAVMNGTTVSDRTGEFTFLNKNGQ